ncbi:hypothetical protein K525DRAFT_361235 [Schizophyllum commune Loenen D]|nr:hypothetical protein K525DRAFT_361235 [Schizophyllum commune Loenen D]
MATAIGVWSEVVKPGTPLVFAPAADLRICNVSLGETLADENARTVLKITHMSPTVPEEDEDEDEDDDEEDDVPMKECEVVLCALTPGKIEQAVVDLILQEEQSVAIEAIGKNEIHLVGNYIEQPVPFNNGEDSEDEDDEFGSEDGYDLRDVSSDVEMDADELLSDEERFEEINEDAEPKSLKRPAADEAPKSKAEKKLKAADGKAVEKKAEEKKDGAEKKDETKKSKKEKKKEKKEQQAKEGKAKEGKGEAAAPVERELPGGIKVKDVKIGDGSKATKGKTVGMRYIGKLTNGKQFDANTKGKPFTFHLGKGEVIKGWDEGIVGMQVGGERQLTIPPAMGYGKRGMDGIPANSTLVFDVKLLSVK